MIEDYTERSSESTVTERRDANTLYDPVETRNTEVIDAHQTYQGKKATVRTYNVIWFFIGLIEALLVFRFVFELLGANPYNAFVNFIYTLSYPIAGPFRTIFGVTNVQTATFDWSLLIAMVVYLLIGYALVQLLRILRPMTPEDVNHSIHTI